MGHVAKRVGQREVCTGAYTIGKPRGSQRTGRASTAKVKFVCLSFLFLVCFSFSFFLEIAD